MLVYFLSVGGGTRFVRGRRWFGWDGGRCGRGWDIFEDRMNESNGFPVGECLGSTQTSSPKIIITTQHTIVLQHPLIYK